VNGTLTLAASTTVARYFVPRIFIRFHHVARSEALSSSGTGKNLFPALERRTAFRTDQNHACHGCLALPHPQDGPQRVGDASDRLQSHSRPDAASRLDLRCRLGAISFKGSLDSLHHFADAIYAAHRKPRKQAQLFDALLRTIASDLVPLRPERSELAHDVVCGGWCPKGPNRLQQLFPLHLGA
jgi:hypothetical protein